MTDTREPPRQVWHLFLLVAVVLLIAVSHLVSDRPLMVASFNNVAPAGDLPPSVRVADDWSVIIHRSDWTPPIARALGHAGGERVRMGWVVREWSLMTLPLVAWRQGDLAAFREDEYGYRLIGLTDEERRAATAAAGQPWFPWWRFVWGWLGIAGIAACAWAELRWQARRRDLLGVM